MLRVAIVGASGGIGAAILSELANRRDVERIFATFHQSPAAGSLSSAAGHGSDATVQWSRLDATDEQEVSNWLTSVGKADWLINCAGMLHNAKNGPEKSISTFDAQHFNDSMAINCLPTLLLGKYARSVLRESERGVFATVSARVGSITDNRLGGWYSYRASKAALNMALKCLSIEWSRNTKSLKVAALHPGTTDSKLSRPFQKNVPEGKLFTPEKTARLLIGQLEKLHESASGRFLAYDGEEIPW